MKLTVGRRSGEVADGGILGEPALLGDARAGRNLFHSTAVVVIIPAP